MKKTFILSIVALFLLFSLSLVNAEDFEASCSQNFNLKTGTFSSNHSYCTKAVTMVTGKIYYENNDTSAPGADVTVTCYHGNKTSIKTTTSLNNPKIFRGFYKVIFSQKECEDGDTVVVSALKGGLTGENSGIVDNTFIKKLDLAIISVPLIPEFGLLVAGLTIFSAVGIFFFVRRK